MEQYDVIIIGGGFFGCSLALHLKTPSSKVLILEKEHELMSRASYNNQARVHGGYHYARSLLTALRSRVNFRDFVAEYGEAVDSSLQKYYAVGRYFSKVSAKHFYLFCKRVGADIEEAPQHIRKLFNKDLIEDVFTVKEYAFDSLKLRDRMQRELHNANIPYRLGTEAERLTRAGSDLLLETLDAATGAVKALRAKQVFNCTYSRINKLHHNSSLPFVPLKHELTELALAQPPDALRGVGITVMDGPFFSTMPFPPRGLHTLSHVRYTPHVSWHDQNGSWLDGHQYLAENRPPTAFHKMLADAKRYMPVLETMQYVDSLWEVKTVLAKSEDDDSRPILFSHNHGGLPGYNVIMGGKIDNIRDILMEVDSLYGK